MPAEATTMGDPVVPAPAARRRCGPWPTCPRSRGRKKPDPIVIVDDMVRRFGGLTAVDVDHVEIQRGAITALIGPNGAGKTTFFNLLTGFDQPDAGDVVVRRHESLKGVPPYKVARMGMVRTFQLTKALSQLTVIENMLLGATGQQRRERARGHVRRRSGAARRTPTPSRADELLARFKLDAKREDFAGSLSGGQRKLLEMARALMVRARAGHARRADGRREPGADPVAARPHQGPARARA